MCAALALVCVSSPPCTCVWVGIGVRVGGGETHLQVGSQRPFERELRLCTGDVSCVSRNLVRTTPTSNRRLVANGRPFRRPGRLQGRVPRRMDQIRSLVDSRRRSSPTAIRESGTSVRLGLGKDRARLNITRTPCAAPPNGRRSRQAFPRRRKLRINASKEPGGRHLPRRLSCP